MYKVNVVKFLSVLIVLGSGAQYCLGALSQPSDIAFKAELDGSTQHYMEMLPTDFDQGKKYDLIIGLHGHGSDRNQFATAKRGETVSFREFASKYNMIAVTPDYRATTSWMGPKAEADLVQIINELKKKYKINRVFIVGASMGGTSVLTFAALHPDMVDGVASLNGQANHLEYLGFQSYISESFGGSKDKIPLEYKKRSAEYWPELLTMPIAFTSGGKDTVVPPESSLRLAEILKKLNRKVLVIHRPDGGHETSFADSMAAMEFMHDPLKPTNVTASPAAAAPAAPTAVANSADRSFGSSTAQPALNDAKGKVELGLKFSVQKEGKIKALRFYQAKSETGAHTLRLWDANGKLVLSVNAPESKEMGWVSAALPEPFAVKPGDIFIVSYTCNTSYTGTYDVFKTPIVRGGITGLAGLYNTTELGQKAPDKTFKDMDYFVDVDYEQQ